MSVDWDEILADHEDHPCLAFRPFERPLRDRQSAPLPDPARRVHFGPGTPDARLTRLGAARQSDQDIKLWLERHQEVVVRLVVPDEA